MNARFLGLIGALTAVCGCAAPEDHSTSKDPAEPALIGSYPTKSGGRLEIFEPEQGQFMIGELSNGDDDLALVAQREPASASHAEASSLASLYQRMVGGAVPAEIRAADARLLAGASQEHADRALTPSYVSEAPAAATNEVIEKEVDRDVETFRGNFCRQAGRLANTDGCQSFNYCRTETTNDKTFREDGVFGAYSVVRPYRGNVVMEVLYNDAMSFSRTVDEGKKYRAWKWSRQETNGEKVTPGNPPFKLETRVRGAEGDGYHVAVLGTRERRYWNAYDDMSDNADRLGCAFGLPDPNATRGAVVGIPLNW